MKTMQVLEYMPIEQFMDDVLEMRKYANEHRYPMLGRKVQVLGEILSKWSNEAIDEIIDKQYTLVPHRLQIISRMAKGTMLFGFEIESISPISKNWNGAMS